MIKAVTTLSIIIIGVPLFFELDINSFTSNTFHLKLSKFESQNLLEPAMQTRYNKAIYESFNEYGTVIYSPQNIDFFWAVGDGPLPSLQKKQYDYFKKYFSIVPVKRSEKLQDGFRSKKIPD
jgi:hypothetical protein